MSTPVSASHPVARQRAQRDGSQAELSRRVGIPCTTVSAIEGERLTPSITAALAFAFAGALECSVPGVGPIAA